MRFSVTRFGTHASRERVRFGEVFVMKMLRLRHLFREVTDRAGLARPYERPASPKAPPRDPPQTGACVRDARQADAFAIVRKGRQTLCRYWATLRV
jgi:hypothetical protein